jgi:DNA modification methylase
MKPAGTDIMDEFYKDHTRDPDTNGVRILDPFMGGGTTVVEALRLGCHVTGIDLNPVAWFIVKTEIESVNIEDLKAAQKEGGSIYAMLFAVFPVLCAMVTCRRLS